MVNAADNTKIKSLRSIGILIFLVSVGEGMTAPAIPLLGNNLGASYSLIGFFMTGYSLTYGIMTILSGRLSDILGRKKILLFSVIICFLASLGYCFAATPHALLVFRTLEGMSRGILWVVLEAILADNTEPLNRGKESGRFTTFYGIGAMLGCVLGGLLMEYYSLTTVFPLYPFLCVLAFFIGQKGVTEIPQKGETTHHGPDHSEYRALWREIKIIWPLCYIFFTYAGFLYSISGLLSMVAGYFDVSYLGIGLIFALFWGCRVFSFSSSGMITERIGRKSLLISGVICLVAAASLFIMGEGFWSISIAAAFGGIGTGILFPLCISMVADMASPGYSGFGMGFLEFIGSIGMIAQTGISGLLGQYGGVRMTYSFTLLVCLIAILIAGVFIKEKTGQSGYRIKEETKKA
ncbi:MAG: MFS transporter [Dehalobacterium sp.]